MSVTSVRCALLRKHEGIFEVLLVQRDATDTYGGHWEFPGGVPEKGETPEQTVVREVKEETGLTVSHFRHIHKNVTPTLSGDIKEQWLFFTTTFQGEPIAGDDIQNVRWVPLQMVFQLPLTGLSVHLFKKPMFLKHINTNLQMHAVV